MARIPQETIDQILDRIDIVELVSEYIHLKRAGRNFKANCPFHNEKTPSFMVSPEKQIFHCFGCNAGGNAIGFVMKHENLDFPEATRMLAQRVGIEIPRLERADSETASLTARLYEINDLAAGFYQNNLKSAKGQRALNYLKKRGINAETIEKFRIGYAPDEWEGFQKHSKGRNIPADLLRKAGLALKSDKGRGDYDRFRNRIIFPIYNERGGIIAFGARILDAPAEGGTQPKYVNSPETAIYSKSNVLYGLNFSKSAIRQKGFVLILEGYMDVIVPFKSGVCNIVATSGTALTPHQVRLLKRCTRDAVMVFDADQAGEAASLRGLDVLIENDMNVRVATLPKGEDPDSFVRAKGAGEFEKIVGEAKDLFDYKLDLLAEKFSGKGTSGIAGIADEMLPTISKVANAVVQSVYLKKLSERLGVHEASLRHEMGKVKGNYSFRHKPDPPSAGALKKNASGVESYQASEVHLLGLAIADRGMFEALSRELEPQAFRDESIKKALDTVSDSYRKEGIINPGKLLSRLENDERAKTVVVRAIAKTDITGDRQRVFADCVACVRRENMEYELKELASRLKAAQGANNIAEVKELLTRINEIHKTKT